MYDDIDDAVDESLNNNNVKGQNNNNISNGSNNRIDILKENDDNNNAILNYDNTISENNVTSLNNITSSMSSTVSDDQSENKNEKIDVQDIKVDGKGKPPQLFVGKLSWETTEEGLKMYFELFGEVESINLVKDKFTSQFRGFGFVQFKEKSSFDKCLAEPMHNVDGSIIEVKLSRTADGRAVLPPSNTNQPQHNPTQSLRPTPNIRPDTSMDDSRKIFVGGLLQEVRDSDLLDFARQFGEVENATVMIDGASKRSRGFGFITFVNSKDAEAASRTGKGILNGRDIEVKMYSSGGSSAPFPGSNRGGGGGGRGRGSGRGMPYMNQPRGPPRGPPRGGGFNGREQPSSHFASSIPNTNENQSYRDEDHTPSTSGDNDRSGSSKRDRSRDRKDDRSSKNRNFRGGYDRNHQY